MIWTLKVRCVAGPYHDAECIRFIDVDEETSLYDLHVAIQDAVHFDDESEFAFFQSASLGGKRAYVPEGVDPEEGVDTDLYEDVSLAENLPSEARRKLYYLFDLDEEWIFEIRKERGSKAPSPHEFYPLVRDDLSVGPDPMQYGNDLDDFVDAEEAAERLKERRDRGPLGEDAEDDFEAVSSFGAFGDDEDDDEGDDEFGGDDDDDDDPW